MKDQGEEGPPKKEERAGGGWGVRLLVGAPLAAAEGSAADIAAGEEEATAESFEATDVNESGKGNDNGDDAEDKDGNSDPLATAVTACMPPRKDDDPPQPHDRGWWSRTQTPR